MLIGQGHSSFHKQTSTNLYEQRKGEGGGMESRPTPPTEPWDPAVLSHFTAQVWGLNMTQNRIEMYIT